MNGLLPSLYAFSICLKLVLAINRHLISLRDIQITDGSARIKRSRLRTCASIRAMRMAVRVGWLVRMRAHYYVLILYREGTNVRTYVKFLAPAA